jgi:hypothetical protein
MTDDTTSAVPTVGDGKPGFHIVVSLDEFITLADRVAHLEANQPASGASEGEVSEDDLEQVHARLTRHRDELEEIKRRYNALIRYLDATMLTPAQAATSQDTVQPPTARNMIQ